LDIAACIRFLKALMLVRDEDVTKFSGSLRAVRCGRIPAMPTAPGLVHRDL
jgi:hypothetical protein